MKIASLILGMIGALLGGLWLSQGLGVVQIEPVACVTACEPLHGPSLQWVIIGFLVFAAGVLAILYGLRGRARR